MRKKTACYTCITGPYDTLNDPVIVDDDVDYICFTDQTLSSSVWQFRDIPDELKHLSKVKQQRVIKICPHRYLPEHDISVWTDGNILVKCSIDQFISQNDLSRCSFYVRVHPSRRCIYDEALACIMLGKDRRDVIEKQVSRYKEEGYPKNLGLAETCIILRKHNDKKCILLDELWATELLMNSCRDQLSFNYAIWKLHIDVGYITSLQQMKQNEMFMINRHHA